MNQKLQMPNDQTNSGGFLMNPVVRRISKINETDDDHATYNGVFKKTMFFLFMVLVGAALALIVHMIPFEGFSDDSGIYVSYLELWGLAAAAVFIVVCPFLAIFLKKTTPVTGSLSCIGNGFLLGVLGIFVPEYRGAMLLAFVLTFALVVIMMFLYFTGKINVTKKFKIVVSSLFGTILLGSLMVGICYFIPGCRDIYNYVQNNLLLSILFSVAGIVIATLFLLMDFDAVHNAVKNKLPKKYEWAASYSLAFTMIWLYFKILDLIITAQKSKTN